MYGPSPYRVYVNTCVCARVLPKAPTASRINWSQRAIYQNWSLRIMHPEKYRRTAEAHQLHWFLIDYRKLTCINIGAWFFWKTAQKSLFAAQNDSQLTCCAMCDTCTRLAAHSKVQGRFLEIRAFAMFIQANFREWRKWSWNFAYAAKRLQIPWITHENQSRVMLIGKKSIFDRFFKNPCSYVKIHVSFR